MIHLIVTYIIHNHTVFIVFAALSTYLIIIVLTIVHIVDVYYLWMDIHTNTHTHTCKHTHTHTHTRIHAHMQTHTHTHVYAHLSIHMQENNNIYNGSSNRNIRLGIVELNWYQRQHSCEGHSTAYRLIHSFHQACSHWGHVHDM